MKYAFRYESPPADLSLRLSPASAAFELRHYTVASVREGEVAYISTVDFDIRQAGCSGFRLVTPEWLGDDIELRGERIRQIRSQLSGADRTWEIELQQPMRGTYRLQLISNPAAAGRGYRASRHYPISRCGTVAEPRGP